MYNQQPPAYIPPSAPVKRGPSCWLVGALTCLGIVILVVIAIVVGITSFTHSAAGKKFASTFGSAMHKSATDAPIAIRNMETIREAIMRYHDHTGSYPDNLQQLVPTYLPDSSVLHSALDSNSNPSHVSYTYTKPTSSSTDSSTLLALHWQMSMSFGDQTQTTNFTYVLPIKGPIRQEQSQMGATTTTTIGVGPGP